MRFFVLESQCLPQQTFFKRSVGPKQTHHEACHVSPKFIHEIITPNLRALVSEAFGKNLGSKGNEELDDEITKGVSALVQETLRGDTSL